MATLVHFIVGQLDLLEADHLLAQLFRTVGGVGVEVETGRRWRVRLASDQPRRSMIGVTVSLVVDGHNVHEDQVAHIARLVRIDTGKGTSQCGEHSSGEMKKALVLALGSRMVNHGHAQCSN